MRSIGQQQVYRKDYANIRAPVLVLLPKTETDYQPKNDEDQPASTGKVTGHAAHSVATEVSG